jgi:hypothetical protein
MDVFFAEIRLDVFVPVLAVVLEAPVFRPLDAAEEDEMDDFLEVFWCVFLGMRLPFVAFPASVNRVIFAQP